MMEEILENLLLTGGNEAKNDRRKQRLTYLVSLSKWMATVLGLGEIKKYIKSYKGQGILESHDRLRSEGTRPKK